MAVAIPVAENASLPSAAVERAIVQAATGVAIPNINGMAAVVSQRPRGTTNRVHPRAAAEKIPR